MELWIGTINLGFLYAFMALGTFITYKIFDFPDITVDGSFTLGGSVSALLIVNGWNPFVVLPVAFLAGCIAGSATGFIHTRFKINGLLSGILVMTALYSVNLRVMGKSNIPLLNAFNITNAIAAINPGIHSEIWLLIVVFLFMAVFWFFFSLFLKTDLGLTMRATGNNALMVSASGINTDRMKIFGLSIANGLVALSGALVAQYQGFSDIGMGVGAVVFSLAAVIIGEAVLRGRSMYIKVLSVIIGSIVFRLMVALALFIGLNPNDLKLITAVFVLLTLVTTGAFGLKKAKESSLKRFFTKYKIALSVSAVIIILAIVVLFNNSEAPQTIIEKPKIGLLVANDAQILTITQDGFNDEMKNLGYVNGENIIIYEQNANGDMPTISSIVDNYISKEVDLFFPISTVCTQATMNKVKEKPIVFATVASPFIINAGTSETDHLPNITGVYGTMPIDVLLEYINQFYSGKIKIGGIWNSSHPNSVSNVDTLYSYLNKYPNMEFVGTTITGTADVYNAALSIVEKDIDVFFIIPDISVFAAFESVVKAARSKNIPIFSGDVERLDAGCLLVYGYDYYNSGVQGAQLVDRILKGEDVASIPFEQYKVATLGVNLDIAKDVGLTLPPALVDSAKLIVQNGETIDKREKRSLPPVSDKEKKVAIFQFTDNILLNKTAEGAKAFFNDNGYVDKYNLKLEDFNANGDFGMGQTIAKNLVDQKFDYILSISTLALQVTANNNKSIPHIFSAVTDPIIAGVVKAFDDHPAHITGLATPQPVVSTFKLMREIFPNAKKVGMIWNNAEANSEYCTMLARKSAKELGFELLERTINNPNEIDEALKALISKDIDIFFTSGDVTVQTLVPSIAQKLIEKKIPYFTNNPDDIKDGSFLSIGANYFEVGKEAAKVLIQVLEGTPPSQIDIRTYVPEDFIVNETIAKKIGVEVPESILNKATTVYRK